jgi:hypothetical protein
LIDFSSIDIGAIWGCTGATPSTLCLPRRIGIL